MKIQDRQSETESLELELAQKEILLQTFFNTNEVFQRAKVLIREIDDIKEKLEHLKKKK